ncbi:hypothetical protein Y032_0081g1465 [Ancylostoma ceylanicum]|uniref:Uncharacterized protein n=1 Tax=Ancylostoma ceylanicum TaxID=53326 RepID=A0A016TRF1_9BILA|nr:hypothetical protein Y032_0081g1465 [Ancylostoma ceylanicum]
MGTAFGVGGIESSYVNVDFEVVTDYLKYLLGKKTAVVVFLVKFTIRLPQALIIRIERVGVLPSGNVFKLADHVEFGETLDVRDFCFYRNKEADYNLAASRRPESTSRIVGGAASNERQLTRRGSSSGLAAPFGIIE